MWPWWATCQSYREVRRGGAVPFASIGCPAHAGRAAGPASRVTSSNVLLDLPVYRREGGRRVPGAECRGPAPVSDASQKRWGTSRHQRFCEASLTEAAPSPRRLLELAVL